MQGTPLFIGPEETAKLEALRDLAIQHPVNMIGLLERLKKRANKRVHMKQMTKQTVYLPAAYAVTFSIETGHPSGTARHMSMSVKRDDRVPNEHAVWMIAELLGFTGELRDCTIWLEDLQGHGKAVNIVQMITAETSDARH